MRLPAPTVAVLATIAAISTANAVEIDDLKDFAPLFGRYAPAGNCQRQPQVVVDANGMTFEVAGKKDRVVRLEYAASYGGNFYQGISQWFFPFGSDGNYPILMTFNADETAGVLAITPHDEGWQGGPPLGPRNKALVDGSPYRRCK
ncbi:hypothetical protein GCM10027084_23380 [Pseudoxanthomonas sangjuensis]|uniref:hypothetical protein n=1 Tax=Pseudoxanthomonas sangjuensis TaxID=1503750 RepID=UPI0013919A98|nr:hypothetical protein [Pseudoxanthomonas sangjuensis]KAF1713597.1 hypothetical protein CSC71_06885 [Pseudoxanthomonas sangjuensis]